ncbi:YggS family pyridoxal phosphate-dependent enzyme [Paraliomyxa miuraensis]|uniref:YggS family pyridoxal phosphate-dependent enzyme n=1 Tax=Paraliomyxa miuraensis TaxID=376150 RepID=UPI00224D3FEA|nr:YggS family pyridoxal phosphate-dependent enzyme [Paraliomyxa miuraensis]MCX4245924.1 YggS family pyridoxal phosphate-dependent enzyme [Paraliomyxa miuraensis]
MSHADATVADVAARLAAVRERIAAAVARRGDGPAVRLVGVSKRQPLTAIENAAAAGLQDFGENYAQELRDKQQAHPHAPWRWHFIGALQSNKVRLVVGCALVHTIDRPKLLPAIEHHAAEHGHVQDVLVQVNVAGEVGKAGIAPHELPALLDRFADLPHVRCRGLMLIPPEASPEATRPHFRALRHLAEAQAATSRPGVVLEELSMGMSADFEVAIEEGATLVRVGTAIFGPRPSSRSDPHDDTG